MHHITICMIELQKYSLMFTIFYVFANFVQTLCFVPAPLIQWRILIGWLVILEPVIGSMGCKVDRYREEYLCQSQGPDIDWSTHCYSVKYSIFLPRCLLVSSTWQFNLSLNLWAVDEAFRRTVMLGPPDEGKVCQIFNCNMILNSRFHLRYTADDANGFYFYIFVSSGRWR